MILVLNEHASLRVFDLHPKAPICSVLILNVGERFSSGMDVMMLVLR